MTPHEQQGAPRGGGVPLVHGRETYLRGPLSVRLVVMPNDDQTGYVGSLILTDPEGTYHGMFSLSEAHLRAFHRVLTQVFDNPDAQATQTDLRLPPPFRGRAPGPQ